MSALETQAQSSVIHALCIGNNGGGKTGSLAGLAEEGYKLRILAFEAGTEILQNFLQGKAGMANVDVELCMDQYYMHPISKLMKAKAAAAFPKAMKILEKWNEYGSPTTWGEDTILVLDTLTSLGRAAMNQTFAMKGKLEDLSVESVKITQPDWGDAMRLQEDLIAMLSSLPCHVIVNSHVTFLTPDGETSNQGFPSALGNKLPPKIGGYFNHQLYFTKQGVGPNKVRGISAKSSQLVETKTSAPGKVKDWYPLDPAHPLDGGLRQYFRDIRGPLKKV